MTSRWLGSAGRSPSATGSSSTSWARTSTQSYSGSDAGCQYLSLDAVQRCSNSLWTQHKPFWHQGVPGQLARRDSSEGCGKECSSDLLIQWSDKTWTQFTSNDQQQQKCCFCQCLFGVYFVAFQSFISVALNQCLVDICEITTASPIQIKIYELLAVTQLTLDNTK